MMNGNQNCKEAKPLEITVNSSYLASAVTAQTGQGSGQCPWFIRGVDGQTLNVTLLDFGVWSNRADETACTVYAKLTSSTSPTVSQICGGRTREQQIYWSSGKQDLRIQIMNTTALPDPVYFLIHFQGQPSNPNYI
jgi:hypothetical protein